MTVPFSALVVGGRAKAPMAAAAATSGDAEAFGGGSTGVAKPLTRFWQSSFWQPRNLAAARGRSRGCNMTPGSRAGQLQGGIIPRSAPELAGGLENAQSFVTLQNLVISKLLDAFAEVQPVS